MLLNLLFYIMYIIVHLNLLSMMIINKLQINYNYMFNQGLIDSLKVRVKMADIAIIDKRIITEYIKYYPTLEHLDNEQEFWDEELYRANPYVQIINGITYRFYPKAFITKDKTAEEYMVFQMSAKMAKRQYFNGITIDNIGEIVDDINALGVIYITKEKMLNGLVSDIDICINHKIDDKSLSTAFKLLNEAVRPGKKPLIHNINKVNIKGVRNLGMDFNKREKATNSVPYCKIYHKGYELLSKSVDFYNAYLSPLPAALLDNLVRYEFTIKAHKHKEYLIEKGFNADFKTLKDLLNAPMKDLRAIAQSGLGNYVEIRKKSKVDTSLTPMEIMIQYYIELLISKGCDRDTLLAFTYLIDSPVAKSRAKSKAVKMIENLTSENDEIHIKLMSNDKAKTFLYNIGIECPF